MGDTEQYRNRIIGHREMAPDALIPNPLNARQHPDYQRRALGASLPPRYTDVALGRIEAATGIIPTRNGTPHSFVNRQ